MPDIWDIETSEQTPFKKNEVKEIFLSSLQKELILNRWKDESKTPPSIPELLKLAFPNDELDGRSKQASLIKEFLVGSGFSGEVIKLASTKKSFELSPEHKEYIKNNYSTMKAMEMARELFGYGIGPSTSEVREINSYLRTLDGKPMYGEEIDSNYFPPRSPERAVSRIKKYVDETKNWDTKKLTPSQKKQIEALIGYLASYRFKHQIDSYESQSDKELFESSFIKYCFNKDDLTQENVDQYILLCSEIVIGSQIENDINMLNREQNRAVEEDGKVSMAIVEVVKNARKDRDECIKRQNSLYKSLTQERSEKLNERVGASFTLLNIVEEMKNEERRTALVKMAEERNTKIKGELTRFSELDEAIVRIFGIDEDLVING
jgi:hypothetical protein